MSKPAYRLKPVLDLRNKAQEDAGRLVAHRRRQLEEAEDELSRRERELNDCRLRQAQARQQMFESAAIGIESHILLDHRTHVSDLKRLELSLVERAEQQRSEVARAQSEVEQAIAALIEAAKQSQMIEKHRQSWTEKIRLDEQRKQQKISDEIGAIIYEWRKEPVIK